MNLNKELADWLENERKAFDQVLRASLDTLQIPKVLKESVYYSINAGGKRLRPLLMKATSEAFNGDADKIYPAAVALEMIHTYSLIHDDLPAMDNDMYRRGLPTNHIKFGEATAILAGDGLLTNSFQMITGSEFYSPEEKVFLIHKLIRASGLEGMVAGQHLDMRAEIKQISLEELEEIHRLKTGRLLTYALEAGAYLANATSASLNLMESLGEQIGLIFQIQDDILDVVGDQELLGKAVGSDKGNDKSTYPGLLGLEGAKEKRDRHYQKAMDYLTQLKLEHTRLGQLTTFLLNREK